VPNDSVISERARILMNVIVVHMQILIPHLKESTVIKPQKPVDTNGFQDAA